MRCCCECREGIAKAKSLISRLETDKERECQLSNLLKQLEWKVQLALGNSEKLHATALKVNDRVEAIEAAAAKGRG